MGNLKSKAVEQQPEEDVTTGIMHFYQKVLHLCSMHERAFAILYDDVLQALKA